MSKIKNIRHLENEDEFKKAVRDATDGHITCDMLDAFRASGLKRGSFKDGEIISDKVVRHPVQASGLTKR